MRKQGWRAGLPEKWSLEKDAPAQACGRKATRLKQPAAALQPGMAAPAHVLAELRWPDRIANRTTAAACESVRARRGSGRETAAKPPRRTFCEKQQERGAATMRISFQT